MIFKYCKSNAFIKYIVFKISVDIWTIKWTIKDCALVLKLVVLKRTDCSELLGWFLIYLAALSDFLGRRTAWMLGRTPPWAMVTPARSLFNSSSFLMASWR